MIRWTEREEAYRLTVSWGDRTAIGVIGLVWAALVSFVVAAPKALILPLLVGAALLLAPILLAFLRSARNGAWIDVDARGGYASWCTTGLSPQESPIGVSRFLAHLDPPHAGIVALLPSGERRVAICRSDIPPRTNVAALVARLNELLQATSTTHVPGEDDSR